MHFSVCLITRIWRQCVMLPVNTTWVMSSYKDGIHGMEWNLFNHNTALIYFSTSHSFWEITFSSPIFSIIYNVHIQIIQALLQHPL